MAGDSFGFIDSLQLSKRKCLRKAVQKKLRIFFIIVRCNSNHYAQLEAIVPRHDMTVKQQAWHVGLYSMPCAYTLDIQTKNL